MTSLNQRIKQLEVYSGLETSVISISEVDGLQNELDTKQDTLSAGSNITIVDNVISSSGSNISDVSGLQDELNTLSTTDTNLQASIDTKQNILTAGDNISIVNNVISSSGDVTMADLDLKQDVLTAGENITITGNTISTIGGSGTTIDSTTDLNSNTITTVGDINCGGIILAPNQISFRATYIGNYIVVNSNTKLPYNVVTRNIGGGYSNSTYEFTAPVSGSYFFHASIFRDFQINDENNIGVDFVLNNGSNATIIQRIENKGYQIHNGTIVTFMNAGERVYIQRSFGRIALVGQGSNQYITFFGYLIG